MELLLETSLVCVKRFVHYAHGFLTRMLVGTEWWGG